MAGKIVVGVDGSEAAHEALRFAAEEAKARGWRLLVIYAWKFVSAPLTSDLDSTTMPQDHILEDVDTERSAAETVLESVLREVFSQAPPVEFESHIVEGDAADALVAAAEDAELIVVGSRGRGRFKSALLGSVSSHVVHHATCPVVVVKATGKT